MHTNQRMHSGFTLLEMIVVIVITGIVGSMMAVFINAPVQGYLDSSRRAEMTDIADTALRRLARDIRTAVPNSIRLPAPAGSTYIEFLPTRDGGRYRANPGGAGGCGVAGDELSFAAADTCFEIVGSPITFIAGDRIVVGSTQADGNPPYISTVAGILRAHNNLNLGAQTKVDITGPALPLWAELPSQRFDVVDGIQQAVTYACEGALGPVAANVDGPARLVRYWGYGFNPVQQAPPLAGPGAASAVLADRLSNCTITYNPVNQRNGLVEISLTITRQGNVTPESISLYHSIHVNNAP